MGDTCTLSLIIGITVNQFQCYILPIALYCLRLFVVVYKHLHTIVFDQGGEIYNVYKLSFTKLLYFLSYMDTCIAIIMYCQRFRCISHMLCQNTFIFGKLCYFCIYVLDIDDTRNGNNMKQKVKSEFSFNYWFNGDKL